jgi:hypothetical protein
MSGSDIVMKRRRLIRMLCPVTGFLIVSAIAVSAFDTTFARTDRFLKRHVCNGGVDYTAAAKDPVLDSILHDFAELSAATFAAYGRSVRLAALINLYNLATIKLIIGNLPVTSIKKIDRAWSRAWIRFGGKNVSLNQIEHTMIRKRFDEPLIHFALVCAAKSCPVLRDGAYTPSALDRQLKHAAERFVNDPQKNRVTGTTLELSKIFSWYGDDFTPRYGSVENFIRKLRGLDGEYTIRYNSYDWSLNSADCSR